MPDYSKGQIYKIVDNGQHLCYIGSTIQPLCVRIASHKRCYKSYLNNNKGHYVSVYSIFDKYGVDNCKILWVKDFPCNSKKELEKEEGNIQKENECVNKVVAGRTMEQYYQDTKEDKKMASRLYHQNNRERSNNKKKQTYQENREYNCAQKRQYRKDNPEKLKEQDRQAYLRNKEQKQARKKEKVECECGDVVCRAHLSAHRKSKRHQQYIQNQNNPQE